MNSRILMTIHELTSMFSDFAIEYIKTKETIDIEKSFKQIELEQQTSSAIKKETKGPILLSDTNFSTRG
jgi:hypothetical protein